MSENLNLLIDQLQAGSKKFSDEEIANLRTKATFWGKTTSNVSKTIDETLYGEK